MDALRKSVSTVFTLAPRLGGYLGGGVTYVHQNQRKLKIIKTKCIFVGFTKRVKGFTMWHPIEGRFIMSRDVTFREKEILMQKEQGIPKSLEHPTNLIEVKEASNLPSETSPPIEPEDDEEMTIKLLKLM